MSRRTRESTTTSEWLSPTEAAEKLGVSVRKLQYMARDGEVERRRDGRRSRYRVRHEPEAATRVPVDAAVGRPAQDTPGEPVAVAETPGSSRAKRTSCVVDAVDAIRAGIPIITMQVDAVDDVTSRDDVEAFVRAEVDELRRELSARLERIEARVAAAAARGPRATPPSGSYEAPPAGFGVPPSRLQNSAAYDDTEPARPPGGRFESPLHAALEAASRRAQQPGHDDPEELHAALTRALAERDRQQTPGPLRIAREAVGWLGALFGWLTGRRR